MEIGKNIDDDCFYEISMDSTHRILICGKTGSGKSYTMGVVLEEVSKIENLISLVIDSQGIFWSFADPNFGQEDELWEWGSKPEGFNLNLLVLGDPVEGYHGQDVVDKLEDKGIKVGSIKLNPSDISPEMWCDLFKLDINELKGIALYNAVRACRRKYKSNYFINNIIDELEQSHETLETTIAAVKRNLNMAQDWEIFEEYEYKNIWELLTTEKINVLDLSVKDHSRYGIRTMVLGVLARILFAHRVNSKRRELLELGSKMPNVILAIDEAQNYCPSSKSTLSKDILIKWAKEGRQPGLSLIVVSQQPSSIDSEILSQCDIKIIHKITSKADFKAIDNLSEDYIQSDISKYLRKLPSQKIAIIIDDNLEVVQTIKIKPRKSVHCG